MADAYARIEPEERVPLAAHTTVRVGGPARFMAWPRDPAELQAWLGWACERRLPWLVLGEGSNVLVADSGYDGLVIVNRRQPATDFRSASSGGDVRVRVDAGESLATLVRWSVGKGLAGLEWAVGIPGTVGGAVAGNAGAFGSSMADVAQGAELSSADGDTYEVSVAELGLSYRRSSLLRDDAPRALLWVDLRFTVDDRSACQARAAELLRRRRDTQPLGHSAGSVFRNPEGACAGASGPRSEAPPGAGALIEQCGLKGASVGGACISDKHANFIINRGDARASDVVALMNRVRRAVYDRFRVVLEPEVRMIGGVCLEEL